MNYTHLSETHTYWMDNIFPHLSHNFQAGTFEHYLGRFAYLPSGKWLKDAEKVKTSRITVALDPIALVKKYKSVCVTYNTPAKPEEGVVRVIYQVSPTMHMEAAFWIWVENNVVQSYAMVFACYNNEKEYLSLLKDLRPLYRSGDSADKPNNGFFGNPVASLKP